MALIPLPPPPPRHPARNLSLAFGALVVLALLGLAFGEPLLEVRDLAHNRPPGRIAKVEAGSVHLMVSGQLTQVPTVVIDGDLGLPAAAWGELVRELTAKGTVVTWDRPGYGWSPLGTGGHDGLSLVHELHAALKSRDAIGPYVQSQDLPGPYVLVGQGLGAVHMRIFAAEYPDEVAGMVLLDGLYTDTPLDALKGRKDQLSSEALKRRLLSRRFGSSDLPDWLRALPSQEQEGSAAVLGLVDFPKAQAAEIDALDQTLQQAQALASLGSKPVKVLTSDQRDDPSLAGRIRQDQAVAQLSTQGDQEMVPALPPYKARTEIGQPGPLLQAIQQVLGNH